MVMELQKLITGYGRFRTHFKNQSGVLYKNLSEQGQRPSAIVIACSDARVDPAIILDCDPGDLLPPYEDDHHYHGTSAALEFGVCHLKIPHIIVLGHSQCGGIGSLLYPSQATPNSFIAKWMELAKNAFQAKTLHDSDLPITHRAELCEKESLAGSLHNLMTFPWIQKGVAEKNIALHGWYFNLSHGTIDRFDEATKQFIPLLHE
jgi:carbonic anhydrase